MPIPIIDIVGQRFGRQTVVSVHPERDRGGSAQFLVRCDCGEEHIVRGYALRNGKAQSCGCLILETITKHGRTRTPEYQAWMGMIKRCENENDKHYKDYGGRGLMVCPEWRHNFLAFLAEIGPRPTNKHSVDRINNSLNYQPGNVRWATIRTQTNNTRRNRRLTLGERTLTISQWARELDVKPHMIMSRLARGWTTEQALETPAFINRTRREWLAKQGMNIPTLPKRQTYLRTKPPTAPSKLGTKKAT